MGRRSRRRLPAMVGYLRGDELQEMFGRSLHKAVTQRPKRTKKKTVVENLSVELAESKAKLAQSRSSIARLMRVDDQAIEAPAPARVALSPIVPEAVPERLFTQQSG